MIWGHPHFRKHPYILNAVSAQLRKDFVNPLAFTVGFDPRNIRYCLMHVLHLGVAHFCNGGALLCLMEYDFFGSLPSFYFIAKNFDIFLVVLEIMFLPSTHPCMIWSCQVTLGWRQVQRGHRYQNSWRCWPSGFDSGLRPIQSSKLAIYIYILLLWFSMLFVIPKKYCGMIFYLWHI